MLSSFFLQKSKKPIGNKNSLQKIGKKQFFKSAFGLLEATVRLHLWRHCGDSEAEIEAGEASSRGCFLD